MGEIVYDRIGKVIYLSIGGVRKYCLILLPIPEEEILMKMESFAKRHSLEATILEGGR